MSGYRLYHYWRSTSSWRVRWAFSYKKIVYTPVAVSLINGESDSPEHRARNPMGYVPALEIEGQTHALCQSLAMIEYLEERHPDTPSLYPRDSWLRACTRQLAETINADTQPLQNLDPQFLHSDDPEKRKIWAQHWIRNGLQAYQTLCSSTAGLYSVGDALTVADLCLIPQLYNARRYEVDLTPFSKLLDIESNASAHASYAAAAPDAFAPPVA